MKTFSQPRNFVSHQMRRASGRCFRAAFIVACASNTTQQADGVVNWHRKAAVRLARESNAPIRTDMPARPYHALNSESLRLTSERRFPWTRRPRIRRPRSASQPVSTLTPYPSNSTSPRQPLTALSNQITARTILRNTKILHFSLELFCIRVPLSCAIASFCEVHRCL